MGCRFCGFAKRKEDENAEWLSLEEVTVRAQAFRGATEVCIQEGYIKSSPLIIEISFSNKDFAYMMFMRSPI